MRAKCGENVAKIRYFCVFFCGKIRVSFPACSRNFREMWRWHDFCSQTRGSCLLLGRVTAVDEQKNFLDGPLYLGYNVSHLLCKKDFFGEKKGVKAVFRPLPKKLRIQKSRIQGYGLFAIDSIKEGTNLGLSHVIVDEEIIRTPLGGFINHSEEPNCVKKCERTIHGRSKYHLITLRDIEAQEELTVRYTFYNITSPETSP